MIAEVAIRTTSKMQRPMNTARPRTVMILNTSSSELMLILAFFTRNRFEGFVQNVDFQGTTKRFKTGLYLVMKAGNFC